MRQSDSGVQRSSDVDGREVYAAWNSVPRASWRARVALPAAPIDAVHRQAVLAALTTSGGSLLLGLLLAAWVARGVRRRAQQQLMAADAQLRESQRLLDRAVAQRHQAEAASRAKDDFLAVLSHEMRNPLGAISAAVGVLEGAEPNSPAAQEARSIIGRQAPYLAHLMSELLAAARVTDGSSAGSEPTVERTRVAPPEPAAGDTLPPSRRRKVLVVEDNGDTLAALRTRLETDGHSVSTATDGAQGLSCLLELKPEVSIVDIALPGRTGLKLARHARAAGYAGRMIALSGDAAASDAREALAAGFDACLAKPVDREQLRASLDVD